MREEWLAFPGELVVRAGEVESIRPVEGWERDVAWTSVGGPPPAEACTVVRMRSGERHYVSTDFDHVVNGLLRGLRPPGDDRA